MNSCKTNGTAYWYIEGDLRMTGYKSLILGKVSIA